MAFNPDKSTGKNNAAANENDNWKAAGFLNFYLPAKDGSRVKLGAIPLKDNKPREKALIEALKADPEMIQKVMEHLEVEFNVSEQSEGKAFAFL